MDDAEFLAVAPNSRTRYPCSPRLDRGTVGLLLAAPSRVTLPADPAAPWSLTVCLACGFSILAHRQLRRDGLRDLAESILFVASLPAAGFSGAGPLRDGKERPDRPERPDPSDGLSDEDAAKHTFAICVNPDLCTSMRLPAKPGTCFVHATLGQLQSNVVAIELVRP